MNWQILFLGCCYTAGATGVSFWQESEKSYAVHLIALTLSLSLMVPA